MSAETPVTITDIPGHRHSDTDIPAIDEANLERFVGQAVVDLGAAISGPFLRLGDRLGLYKAMGRSAAAEAGVSRRARFEVATA